MRSAAVAATRSNGSSRGSMAGTIAPSMAGAHRRSPGTGRTTMAAPASRLTGAVVDVRARVAGGSVHPLDAKPRCELIEDPQDFRIG